MQEAFIEKLKLFIIETLNLEDVAPEDIDPDAGLFGSGLDLDSIDALELVVQLEKEYGIKVASSEASRQMFASLNVLAEFIQKHGKVE